MEDYSIEKYMVKSKLNVEQMILDFKPYVKVVIENNSKGMLSYEDKEEVMSDVFLTIWHNKDKIDPNRSLKSYIAGVTQILVLKKLRDVSKFGDSSSFIDLDEDTDYYFDMDFDIELIYTKEEVQKAIKDELGKMKREDYEIFTKFYYSSENIKNIATEMNMSEINVKVRLCRIRNKLRTSLEDKGIKYAVIIVILIIGIVTGTVFANEIVEFIKRFFGTSEGVDKAINNGYIQNVDMDYVSSDNIEVKVDSILMDDYNLDIMFCINVKGEDNRKVENVEIPDLLITDENDNVIVAKFSSYEEQYKFCSDKNIDISNAKIYGSGSRSTKTIHIGKDEVYFSFATSSQSFPRSKKLKLQFDKIVVDEMVYEGNFEISVELPEEFYNREVLVYSVKSINIDDVKVARATVSETGMELEMEMPWGIELYDENDSEEEKEYKLNKWLYEIFLEDNIKDEYVINSNAEKFKVAITHDIDKLATLNANGTLNYIQNFNLTILDATQELTVVVYLNDETLKIGYDELVIELERNEGSD